MAEMRWILASVMLGLSALASAQIVECIDADGRKAYLPACPGTAVKERDIEVPPPPVKPAQSNNVSKPSIKDQETAFERRRQERLKAEAAAAETEKKAQETQQKCANAKKRAEFLNMPLPYQRGESAITGDHVPSDANQRQAEIEQINAEIQDTCH